MYGGRIDKCTTYRFVVIDFSTGEMIPYDEWLKNPPKKLPKKLNYRRFS